MNFLTRWVVKRKLKEVLEMKALSGYKTYIIAGAIAILEFLIIVGALPPEWQDKAKDLIVLLAGLGGIALRQGIKKAEVTLLKAGED